MLNFLDVEPLELINQNISEIIPLNGHNEIKFYQQIKFLSKKKFVSNFTRLLSILNRDSLIDISVTTTLIQQNEKNYFLLHFFPNETIQQIENEIEKLNSLLTNFIIDLTPLNYFLNGVKSDEYQIHSFQFGILTLVFHKNENQILTDDILQQLKNPLLLTAEYLSGNNNCFVIESSPTHSLVLFVNKEKKTDCYNNSLNYINHFQKYCEISGFCLELEEFEIIIFNPPISNFSTYMEEISLENAHKQKNTFSVDLISSHLYEISNIMNLIRKNTILTTKLFIMYNNIPLEKCSFRFFSSYFAELYLYKLN